jgi:outer membrane protein OmpA-like peptidoglycan-associated protein
MNGYWLLGPLKWCSLGASLAGIGLSLSACAPSPRALSVTPESNVIERSVPGEKLSDNRSYASARVVRFRVLSSDSNSGQADVETVNLPSEGLRNHPENTDVVRVSFDKGIFFNTGSSALRKEAGNVTAQIAANIFADRPSTALTIVGYSNSSRSDKLDQDLSVSQGLKLMERLQELGVPSDRIRVVGLGRQIRLGDTAGERRGSDIELYLSDDPKGNAAALAARGFPAVKEIGPCRVIMAGEYECSVSWMPNQMARQHSLAPNRTTIPGTLKPFHPSEPAQLPAGLQPKSFEPSELGSSRWQ